MSPLEMAFEWTATATVVASVILVVIIAAAAAAFCCWPRRVKCSEEPLLTAVEQREISIELAPSAGAGTRAGAISYPVRRVAGDD